MDWQEITDKPCIWYYAENGAYQFSVYRVHDGCFWIVWYGDSVHAHGFSEELSHAREQAENSILTIEGFRQGWKEATTGQTHPISELWDGIEFDEP